MSFGNPQLQAIEEDHFAMKYKTCWQEFIFVGDHGDIPKVYKDGKICYLSSYFQNWKSIRACYQFTLDEIRRTQGRQIKRVLAVTDTGGENWGTSPLCQYSFFEQDFKVSAIWCPTAAHHSG